jgi:RNA polymerase sigma-B factor
VSIVAETSAPELPLGSDAVLLRRYRDGDLSAREHLARRHMPLARWIARRYWDASDAQEDLEQVAYLGLLKSIDRFDPELGSFQNFAMTTIRGELRRYFRDHGWALKVPRPLQENYVAVKSAMRGLAVELGRSPTPRDIAERTGLSLDDVVEAMDVNHAYAPQSLDAPLAGDDAESASLGERLGRDDHGFVGVEDRELLGEAFRHLDSRQQEVVRLRFVEDLTQGEIAERLGVSQMSISRWLRGALSQLSQAA